VGCDLAACLASYAAYAFRASPVSSVAKTIDAVLPDIADYREPTGMQAGTYALKAKCYDEYDAFFTHLGWKRHAEARERWQHHRKSHKSTKPRPPCPPPLPTNEAYMRVRRLLHVPACVVVVRNVLRAFLANTERPPEALLAAGLHLLALALHTASDMTPEALESFTAELCDTPNVSGEPGDSVVSLVLKLEAAEHTPEHLKEALAWVLLRFPKLSPAVKEHQYALPGGKRKKSKKAKKGACVCACVSVSVSGCVWLCGCGCGCGSGPPPTHHSRGRGEEEARQASEEEARGTGQGAGSHGQQAIQVRCHAGRRRQRRRRWR